MLPDTYLRKQFLRVILPLKRHTKKRWSTAITGWLHTFILKQRLFLIFFSWSEHKQSRKSIGQCYNLYNESKSSEVNIFSCNSQYAIRNCSSPRIETRQNLWIQVSFCSTFTLTIAIYFAGRNDIWRKDHTFKLTIGYCEKSQVKNQVEFLLQVGINNQLIYLIQVVIRFLMSVSGS